MLRIVFMFLLLLLSTTNIMAQKAKTLSNDDFSPPEKVNQPKISNSSSLEDISSPAIEESFQLKVHNSLPVYILKYTGEEVEVYKKNSQDSLKLVQTIDVEHEPLAGWFIKKKDANFDGYLDLIFPGIVGATGNITNNYWLYDQEKGLFVHNDILSELSDLEFEPKTKTISSYNRTGGSGAFYITQIYLAENGKLILIEEIEQKDAPDRKNVLKVTKKRINGKLKVVEEKSLTFQEAYPK